MSSELLDFRKRDNFDFLKFSSLWDGKEDEKRMLKSKCEYILDVAQETVQNMCILGWHLKELKESRKWEGVIEPKSGLSYMNFSFQDFCEEVFGFSHTLTSNLLRITKFVKISGAKGGFIDERYAGYNTSQLVELAPVREEDRRFFNPGMSVKTMRVCKDYMKMGSFFEAQFEKDFDLKTYAEAWKEGKQQKAVGSAPAQLPGQIQMEEIDADMEEVETDPYEPAEGDFFQGGGLDSDEDEEREQAKEKAHAAGIPFYDGDMPEDWNPYVYDGNMSVEDYKLMHKHMDEAKNGPDKSDVGFIIAAPDGSEELDKRPKYNFSTRTGARAFLADYQNWESKTGFLGCLFVAQYQYRFRNGMSIWGITVQGIQGNGETLDYEEKPLFFLWEHECQKAALITQNQFERFCAMHHERL